MTTRTSRSNPCSIETLESRTLLASVPAGFSYSVLAPGTISRPTALDVAKDGRIFVTQQAGAVRLVKDGVLAANPVFTIPSQNINAPNNTERGLLGIALDPNFQSNGYLYVYYTATTPAIHNRISRFTVVGDTANINTEFVLMDLPNLNATNHNGGAIHFGPDGKLYAGVGENAQRENAQTLANPLGKILRINSDGSIPTDNPFYNQTTGNSRAIWALGLRNPYTFAFQPGTGKMYINDVGEGTWEEIDPGVAGANYGWPRSEGFKQPNDTSTTIGVYQDPVFAYNHDVGNVISGGVFYNPKHMMFPADYQSSYFYADAGADFIHRLRADNSQHNFGEASNAPVDFQLQADGSLLVLRGAGGNGTLDVVRYTSIQGHVFNDTNSNGVRDAGEAPIAGWTVYDDANNNGQLDNGEKSDVTDENGLYVLGGLSAGTHNVRQVLKSGYRKTTPGSGVPGHTVSVAAGEAATAKNFGNTTNILLAGTIYNDVNNNGSRDAGEAGIGGIIVNIYSNNQVVATRTTDANGAWRVQGLSQGTGSAELEIGEGYIPRFPLGGVYAGSMTSGQANANLNFGLRAFGAAPTPAAAASAVILTLKPVSLNFFDDVI